MRKLRQEKISGDYADAQFGHDAAAAFPAKEDIVRRSRRVFFHDQWK